MGKRHSALKGRNLAHFLFSVLATKRSSARFSTSKCCLATLLSLCPRAVVSMVSSDPRLTFRQMGKSTITAGPKARERTECQHPWFSISSLRIRVTSHCCSCQTFPGTKDTVCWNCEPKQTLHYVDRNVVIASARQVIIHPTPETRERH